MDERRSSGGTNRGRRAFLRATGVSALAGFAGCSGGGPSNPSDAAGSKQGAITLEYVDVAGTRSREVFQPVVDELNERYDATIELQFTEIPYENVKSQLLTRLGGGNAPDLAAIDQIWLGEFIDGGSLLALDGVADDIGFDDYLPAFREPVREGGHVYGLPISTDVRGMYWNKRLFERAGLDPESPPATWSELLDAAEKLHDPPETYGAAHFVVSGRWTVNLFAAGGSVLADGGTEPAFQKPPGVEAASFVDELYNGRSVGPPEPPYQDGARLAREFLQGQHAITVVEGSWLDYFWENLGNEPEAMTEQFGFAPTPAPEGKEPVTMSGGHTWGAFESTDHPEVVRDFLRIAGSRSFKRHLAVETGKIPTRQSLLDADEIWDNVLYSDTVKDLLESTRTRPIRNWSVVENALDPALQRVAFGREEPEAALATAADEVRSELE